MPKRVASRLGAVIAALLPAAATIFYAFQGGGYFIGSTGIGAAALVGAIVLRVTLAERPFAGIGRYAALSVGALGAYAVWVLLSAYWSESAWRALAEFDRVLLYLAALFLFASLPRSPDRTATALRALMLAIAIVSAAGLVTRVLPEVWSIGLDIQGERLSYPLTYWNAQGLLAALGLVLALHGTCSEREPVWMRVASAAALPVLASCLFFTLSRGGIAVAALGAVMYLALARPSAGWTGMLAGIPMTALAVVASYDASLLTTERPTTAAAVAQGQDAAAAIAAYAVAAGVIRLGMVAVDRRIDRRSPWWRSNGVALRRAGAVALAVAAVAGALAVDLPQRLEGQYERFVDGSGVDAEGDARSRLADVGNNGRLDHWGVALDAFQTQQFRGTGAGTYTLEWARERPTRTKVEDAHSLYLEVLSELGLVGIALLLIAIGALLAGFARRARGRDRHTYSVLFAMGLMWAAHAAIDWDWEMPAVTLWFWAFGGMALAASGGDAGPASPARFTRVLVGTGCLALAVTPVLMVVSQSRLDDGVDALKRGDCGAAIESALGSLEAMPVRPQPFEVLGYCNVRLGLDDLAVGAFESAIDRDPDNWELHYGLALARASAGLDPRRQIARARRLNPREQMVRDAGAAFDTDDPRRWRREARQASLPI